MALEEWPVEDAGVGTGEELEGREGGVRDPVLQCRPIVPVEMRKRRREGDLVVVVVVAAARGVACCCDVFGTSFPALPVHPAA